MTEPSPEEALAKRLRETETEVLRILYEAYPNRVRIDDARLTDIQRQIGLDDHEFTELLEDMEKRRLVSINRTFVPGHELFLVADVLITPAGIRVYGGRQPSITYDELGNLNRARAEQVAKLAETVNAAINGVDQKVNEGLAAVDQKMSALQEAVTSAERDFYGRVIPFFAAFVGAFALIISGAQFVSRNIAADVTGATLLAADPWWRLPVVLLGASLGMMVPIGMVVVGLVWVTVGLTRRKYG